MNAESPVAGGRNAAGGRIAIIDYGRGNLRSVEAALSRVGAVPELIADPDRLDDADGAILPGVGSFHDAMTTLEATGFAQAIREFAARGRPVLGLCLGMQLLFEAADEGGPCRGLGLIRGRVARLEGTPRLPHIGWNAVELLRPSGLLSETGRHFFFVHSYGARDVAEADTTGIAEYGHAVIPAVVERKNVMGTQFHPERSGTDGLALLRRFAEVTWRC